MENLLVAEQEDPFIHSSQESKHSIYSTYDKYSIFVLLFLLLCISTGLVGLGIRLAVT